MLQHLFTIYFRYSLIVKMKSTYFLLYYFKLTHYRIRGFLQNCQSQI